MCWLQPWLSKSRQHRSDAPHHCWPADAQAVEMFLDEKIGYLDIVKVVEATCETHKADLMQQPSLQARRLH